MAFDALTAHGPHQYLVDISLSAFTWSRMLTQWCSHVMVIMARMQYDSAGLMAFLHVTPRSHFSLSPHIWRVTAAHWAIERRCAMQSMSH